MTAAVRDGDQREGDARRFVAYLYAVGGALIILGGIGVALTYQTGSSPVTLLAFVNFGLVLALSGIVVASGVLLVRSDVPPARYPRAATWFVVSAVGLLALNLPLMIVIQTMEVAELLGWGYNVTATGAAAGAVVGLVEARAIQRARVAERESARAEVAEARTEELDFLNSLLRHEVLNKAAIIGEYAKFVLEDAEESMGEAATGEATTGEAATGEATTGEATTAKYLETIRGQSEEMVAVITDVRILIDAFQSDDTGHAVDLGAVLEEELTRLRESYDVEVDASIPDDVHVRADELLHRVFGNLLTNAASHGDEATTRVSVTVEETDGHVTVHLADDGPGVPAAVQERLFERSGRGNHGFGLYLVGTLVERYGGTVELTETGPDGSVFSVTLPRAADDAERSSREDFREDSEAHAGVGASPTTPAGTGQ